MISADFAPNEQWIDAVSALKMLVQPWRWKKGKTIFKLKQRLKRLIPGHEVFLFLTARAGLYRVLQGLGLEKNTEVLLQAFTCEAVVLPIKELRLKPVFVDIGTKTYSMDPEDLQKKMTPKAKVLILQHTFGMTPFNRREILDFARKNSLFVIEDVAHGFDPELFMTESHKSTLLLSFGRSKALSSVYGGAIITKSRKITEYLKSTEKILIEPSTFFIMQTLMYKPLAFFIKNTYDIFIGKFFHFLCNVTLFIPREITRREKEGELDMYLIKAYPNALAYLLLKQLKRFDQIRQHRAEISELYELSFHSSEEKTETPLIRYPLLIENREKVLRKARKRNIFLGVWYDQVIAPKEIDMKLFGYKEGSCPRAENLAKRIINLPTLVTRKQAQRVIKLVSKYADTGTQ